jgi:hypothetical protein
MGVPQYNPFKNQKKKKKKERKRALIEREGDAR